MTHEYWATTYDGVTKAISSTLQTIAQAFKKNVATH